MEYIVARELHESGEPHLHAYIRLAEKKEIVNPRFFDLQPKDSTETYHGNYRSCRTPKSVQRYCTKDNNYVSNMDLTEESKEIWKPARALAKEGKVPEAIALLETKVLSYFANTYHKLTLNMIVGYKPTHGIVSN